MVNKLYFFIVLVNIINFIKNKRIIMQFYPTQYFNQPGYQPGLMGPYAYPQVPFQPFNQQPNLVQYNPQGLAYVIPADQQNVPVPRATHAITTSLLNRIDQMTSPYLSRRLRHNQAEANTNETYEDLRASWQQNRLYYPHTEHNSYRDQVDAAIQASNQIVRNQQTKRSRIITLLISLTVLGVLTGLSIAFKQRFPVNSNAVRLTKLICKIVASVKLIQLIWSGLFSANTRLATEARLHVQNARTNPNLRVAQN